jgi:hypothetical protein
MIPWSAPASPPERSPRQRNIVDVASANKREPPIELWIKGELKPDFVRQEEIAFAKFANTKWGAAVYS